MVVCVAIRSYVLAEKMCFGSLFDKLRSGRCAADRNAQPKCFCLYVHQSLGPCLISVPRGDLARRCRLLAIAVWGMQFRRPEAALERSYALSKFVCMNASKEAAHCSLWLALLCLVWVNVQVIIIAFLLSDCGKAVSFGFC